MFIHPLPSIDAGIITISNTAKTLEDFIRDVAGAGGYRIPTGPRAANALFSQVLTNGIRYSVDGNTPTATKGFNAVAGDTVNLKGIDLSKVLLIRSTGSDATMQIALAKLTAGEF